MVENTKYFVDNNELQDYTKTKHKKNKGNVIKQNFCYRFSFLDYGHLKGQIEKWNENLPTYLSEDMETSTGQE